MFLEVTKRKPKRKPQVASAADPRAMLETLRSYDGVFATAKLTSGGTTIEVTFNDKPAGAPQRRHEKKKPPQRTYIDSLSLTPPPFEGWEQ